MALRWRGYCSWSWRSSPPLPLNLQNTGCSTPPIREAKMADVQQITPAMTDAEREVAQTQRKEKISAAIRYVILLFVGLLMLYPLAWMFSASFKPNHEIFTTLGLWPAHPTSDGFVNGWKTGTE